MVFFFTHPVELVQLERSLYKKMTDKAKSSCKEHGLTDLQASTPCSCSISMHYSFDYAQQVHLPSDPLQPGPIYFLVPRKLGLFGFCCEIFCKIFMGYMKVHLPRQVNFLIDEAHLISKGSNAVVSYMHYFF